jgi:hypothetical protein
MSSWPMEVLNVMSLSENNGKTTFVLRGWPHRATEEEVITFNGGRSSMEGFAGSFEKLDQYLNNIINA